MAQVQHTLPEELAPQLRRSSFGCSAAEPGATPGRTAIGTLLAVVDDDTPEAMTDPIFAWEIARPRRDLRAAQHDRL